MRTSADRADNEAVTKNECVNIPNVTQPPWNFPPTLNVTGSGNSSGNSPENNSTISLGANATLAMNLPPFATSVASLVQGRPADSIGTS